MNALDIPNSETEAGSAGPGGALGCPGSAPRPSRRRRGGGLRSQLVSTALLAAGLPVLLTGTLAVYLLAAPPEFAATGLGAARDALAGDAGAEPAALARAPVDWAGPGHARILNASAGADDRSGFPFSAGPHPGRTQFPRAGDGPAVKASNAGSLASVLERLGVGQDIMRSILARIPDPAVLSAVVGDALSDRRVQLALALGAIALLSALFAAILAGAAARRYAAALRAVTEMAERAAGGERARMPVIESPREIARLGDAVDRLARLCNRVGEPRPVGGAHAR